MQRIALVSCVKSKLRVDAAAKDLYVSPLFQGLRGYAERNSDAWYILSAKYGLLRPEQSISPYELTLNAMPKVQRESWAERVRSQLSDVLPVEAEIVLLAGARYREAIEPFLRRRGYHVNVPMEGLTMGRQLAWLKRELSTRDVG
jgi:hypothetical protein